MVKESCCCCCCRWYHTQYWKYRFLPLPESRRAFQLEGKVEGKLNPFLPVDCRTRAWSVGAVIFPQPRVLEICPWFSMRTPSRISPQGWAGCALCLCLPFYWPPSRVGFLIALSRGRFHYQGAHPVRSTKKPVPFVSPKGTFRQFTFHSLTVQKHSANVLSPPHSTVFINLDTLLWMHVWHMLLLLANFAAFSYSRNNSR